MTGVPFKLHGVGPKVASHLARLDIHSLRDLLLHLPARYQDRTRVTPIYKVKIGEDAVVEGVVRSVIYPVKGKTKVLIEVCDDTGVLRLRFFHALTYQKQALVAGTRLRCFGEVRLGQAGYEMTHPEFKIVDAVNALPIDNHLTPIYPATEGLSQYMLRKLTTAALQAMVTHADFRELLPAEILQQNAMPTLQKALQFVHRPPRDASVLQLMENQTLEQQRLVFEELLAHRLSLLRTKDIFQSHQAIPLRPDNDWVNKFLQVLPFPLTAAQKRVAGKLA